ncbi:NAD(P)-dependent oxidoreductase [Ramlibacter tataouinensis]|uniref:NAD(P)-dependent oxidoreductase n=1 Tax=Ramlibacter tataouinensis TaxID=94132 RepID=UPI0022F3C7BF|nr:NAD(P)-dependent oxidoreductase [Ramlibacter tataouinensis]WBY01047.1 NAD(P)-dependent oxidoreductase [Ramlibacter tataouinensis]
MGHGIARNVLKHGYALTALEHPGNQPIADLLEAGATTQATARAVAAQSDFIILCVTGSPEVEAVLGGADGVLQGLRPGSVVIDCSTAIPESTERMALAVQAAGGLFIDAPMTRTAQAAHEGRLNLLVGGDEAVVAKAMPLLRTFAEVITHVGPVGAGHRLKLLHNFVSIGSVVLLAEAAACAARGGIDAGVFVDVLASGGGAGVALDRLKPYLLAGDASGLQFSMSNALKDLRYYVQMAGDAEAARRVGDAVAATLDSAVAQGGPKTLVPELVTLLGAARPASA